MIFLFQLVRPNAIFTTPSANADRACEAFTSRAYLVLSMLATTIARFEHLQHVERWRPSILGERESRFPHIPRRAERHPPFSIDPVFFWIR